MSNDNTNKNAVLDGEIWLPVVGYEDNYMVSNLGRVKNLARISAKGSKMKERIQKTKPNWTGKNTGYCRATFTDGTKHYTVSVHKVVCEAFHGPAPTDKHQVAHGDGNPENNHADNLRWATPKENQSDRKLHGTECCGEKNGRSKLKAKDVYMIRALYAIGKSNKSIAKQFDVTYMTIWNITNRNSWTHLGC